jgi:Ca2+-binding EF-hand superfamily protein
MRAAERFRSRNQASAKDVRDQKVECKHRQVVRPGTKATDAEIKTVAEMLNQRMAEIIMEPAGRSWYKLFVHMDDDSSGKIDYHELEDMIRNELRLSDAALPAERFKSIWRALDADGSGRITCGEFGSFMRLGVQQGCASKKLESCLHAKQQNAARLRQQSASASTALENKFQALVSARRARVSDQRESMRQAAESAAQAARRNKSELAAAVRKDKVKDLTLAPVGGDRVAKPSEVEFVANLLNQRMDEMIQDKSARSWFKLFIHMDDDGSGNVTFIELVDMIRNELKVPEASVSREQLLAVWRVLDDDNSGIIKCGEFGKFMRKGRPAVDKDGTAVNLLALERLRDTQAERQRLQKLHLQRRATESAALSARQNRAATSHSASWGGKTSLETATPWRSPRAFEAF